MIIALIPAAGKSLRMGRPKLLLPVGERTVLERVVSAFAQAGVERVLVVTPPHLPELFSVARCGGAEAIELPHETADMRATVQIGLDWIETHWSPLGDDAWFLAPADHPVLEPAVIRELIAAREVHPERSIFVPAYHGQRGHPTLVSWYHVTAIRTFDVGQGLNAYFRSHAEETWEVSVATESVLSDLDTPADYARLS